MQNIIIRNAQLEDLKDIQNLNNELFILEKEKYDPTLVVDWPHTDEGKEYFKDLIENHFVVVAMIDERVVGYLAGSINEKKSYTEVQYGEIENMIIDEKYRGYGIGKKLINSFKKYCKSKDITNLKVLASFKNRNAINFYHNNGFKEFEVTLTAKI